MDEADQASDREAIDREAIDRERALKAARSIHSLPSLGACHWCHSPVEHLFCGAGCRDDWQKAQDARSRNGV
jgi:hypothetical protein